MTGLRQQENDTEHRKTEGVPCGCGPFVHGVHGVVRSLVVTLIFCIVSALMPPFTAFLGLAIYLTTLFLMIFADQPGLASRLDALSRGRLIAMLAAVALYPPLPPTLNLFLTHHPQWVFAANLPAGLKPALAFALLAAVQTGMALAALLAPCPAVCAALLRVAGVLPTGPSRWLRRRLLLAQRRFERTAR